MLNGAMANQVVLFGRELLPNAKESGHKYAELSNWLMYDFPTRSPTVFFIDLPSRRVEFKFRSKCRNYFMVLVRIEPPTVNPRQYSPSINARFDAVIGGHEPPNRSVIPWTTGYQIPVRVDESKETVNSKGVVFIASRKISFVTGEMYSTRDLVVQALANRGSLVRVVGAGWGKPSSKPVLSALIRTPSSAADPQLVWKNAAQWYLKKPKSERIEYAGYRSDVASLMAAHECTLVIENELSYVSEKLVNAIQASRKILYLGSESALPNFRCACFMGYSKVTDLMLDIQSGVVDDFISQNATCSPSCHKEAQELLESLRIEPRLEALKHILEKVAGLG